ncbi:hypothetical protein D3C81_1163110 [compost metagenome]
MLDDTIAAGLNEDSVVTQFIGDSISTIVPILVSAGIEIRDVHKINPTLEQLFLEMTEGESIE